METDKKKVEKWQTDTPKEREREKRCIVTNCKKDERKQKERRRASINF